MPKLFVTGSDRGLGLSLCKEFLTKGWTVFAGSHNRQARLLSEAAAANERLHIVPLDVADRKSIASARDEVLKMTDSLDMIICNAVISGHGEIELRKPPMDLAFVMDNFRVNALGALMTVEAFLPLMDAGRMKRVCFISSEISSMGLIKGRTSGSFAYPMSKGAMNMAMRILHNQLYPQGYTFRLYHPGWMNHVYADGARSTGADIEVEDSARAAGKIFGEDMPDEQRLVFIDYLEQEFPF